MIKLSAVPSSHVLQTRAGMVGVIRAASVGDEGDDKHAWDGSLQHDGGSLHVSWKQPKAFRQLSGFMGQSASNAEHCSAK